MMIYRFINYLLLFLLISCAKDRGNYDYDQINRLTITSEQGDEINGRNIGLSMGQEAVLRLKITGTLNPVDANTLDFYWIVNGDTISRDKQLIIDGDKFGVGISVCKLVVVDPQTTLSYSSAFSVSVNLGVDKGSFILTETEQQESILVVRSLHPKDKYIFFNSLGSIRLGKRPIGLEAGYLPAIDSSKVYLRLLLATTEGEYPIVITNFYTLLPMETFPRSGSVVSGEILSPSYYFQPSVYSNKYDIFNGVVLINGKSHSVENGRVSANMYPTDPLDYDFGRDAITYHPEYKSFIQMGFDKKNERIRIFGNDGRVGPYTKSYDEITVPLDTKGYVYMGATNFITSQIGQEITWQFLLRKGVEIKFIKLYTKVYLPISARVITTRSIPEMVDAIGFQYDKGYWYFAKGRTIYRFADTGLNIEPYLTLPADQSGDITAWNFYKNAFAEQAKNIGVATYNPTSSEGHKGSYYLYDIQSKKFEQQDRYVIDKAVDIELCL